MGLTPTCEDPAATSWLTKDITRRDGLKALDGGPWKTRIAEPKPAKGYLRWHGDDEARAAVYGNRSRLRNRAFGKQAMRKRGEMVVRSFAHAIDRGGMRRAWLRGRQNVDKRYLIHVAGFNLGIQNPAMFGQGTPREAASARAALLFFVQSTISTLAGRQAVILAIDGETAMRSSSSRPRCRRLKKRHRHRAGRHCLATNVRSEPPPLLEDASRRPP